jgi:hypothetical protein
MIVRILLPPYMLLTTPAIEELQKLELPSLIDMLALQTGFYSKFIREAGFAHESETFGQLIADRQKAIELKESPAKNQTSTSTANLYTCYKI